METRIPNSALGTMISMPEPETLAVLAGQPDELQQLLLGQDQGSKRSDRPLSVETDVLQDTVTLLAKRRSRIITYSPNVTLVPVNACRNNCSYCNFRVRPEIAEISTRKDRLELIRRARHAGATEALICGGEGADEFPVIRRQLESAGLGDIGALVMSMCSDALDGSLLPHVNIGIMTSELFRRLAPMNASMGLMLETAAVRLTRSGEVHVSSPGKLPSRRLAHIVLAGRLGVPFTTGILLGIGETERERLISLLILSRIHHQFRHIQEVIIQNRVARDGSGQYNDHFVPISFISFLRTVAFARLIMPADVHIQVPPNLVLSAKGFFPEGHEFTAAEIAGRLFDAGADDWGGVSTLSPDVVNPGWPWPTPDSLRQITEKAGYTLLPRAPVHAEHVSDLRLKDVRLVNLLRNLK